MPLPRDAKPVCADPKWRELVDATYDREGGTRGRSERAGQILREVACPECPERDACLLLAMTSPEWGMWGGTTQKERTRRGAPSVRGPGRAA